MLQRCVTLKIGRCESSQLRGLDDSQRRFLKQHSVAMLEQCCNHSKQCRNNVATLCYAKNWSLRIVSCNITFRVKFFKTSLFRNCQKRLEHKENQTKYREMTRKPRSRVSILIYRTWWAISARERDQKASELIAKSRLYIADRLAFSKFGLLTYLLSVSYLEAL